MAQEILVPIAQEILAPMAQEIPVYTIQEIQVFAIQEKTLIIALQKTQASVTPISGQFQKQNRRISKSYIQNNLSL
ncbi:25682_t:CDS:2 [Dentiscutata erythropus]|uniref:25682_t:CDS:1 n=1 Tax=Dentiscutata erythropus TaxID=1348616 RepID=A0A9N8YMP6_9GLOM|nr:25682_t:CDS:2 [Dentiscutata erythropus]